jgi:ABC-2 type transport system permease protein
MGIILGNIIAIYRRELQSYFASPLAYAIAGIFWLLSGFFFVIILLGPEGIIQQVVRNDLQGQQMGLPFRLWMFLRIPAGVFELARVFSIVHTADSVDGALCGGTQARYFGATRHVASDQLGGAVGKLLGVLTFFTTMVLPLLAYEAIALSAASPPVQPAIPLLGHLGLILLAGAVLSLGMFISSLTDSTILAAVLTFA